MRIPLLALLSLFWSITACTQPIPQQEPQTWQLVVYNVENMFDADGVAVFNDYKPDVYTPEHLFTKIDNMARLMAHYNDGAGPDILVLSEVESDHSNPLPGTTRDVEAFLQRFENTTLKAMLTESFSSDIADISSEMLLIKGMHDRGLVGYDVSVAYGPLEDGLPGHVQKNVTLSRLPILHERTRVHPVEDARPILETWIDVQGYPLVVFGNHWKSRASDAEIERTRVQNATVLRNRIDELRAENPHLDFVLGGDFNSDYNQSYRYDYMETTGVNDVLGSIGDETRVASGSTEYVYNLWHEIPVDERGSDVFRGYWGTLMQLMVSSGMYDYNGIQYVDNSFEVTRIPGKNVYETSMTPIRWHSFGQGGGYSDHLPIAMKFTITNQEDTARRISLENPGTTDNEIWSPIAVSVRIPEEHEYRLPADIDGSLRKAEYFNELFRVDAVVDNGARVRVNGEVYDLYAPSFNVRDRFASFQGQQISFYGRLGQFRGRWQFVIESEDYVL